MKGEHEMLRQENLNLKDSLKRKQEELCDFSDKVYVLEHHIREVESAKEKETAVKLDQEKQMLEAAVHSKDQEIAKLRQANQLLESNVEESEAELEKLKSKLTSGERLSESVNFELRNKLKVMEKEVAEYERKIGGLEEVKAILQDQVTTLTTQIHLKFQNDHNF
jgi:chromosome segregation ATPase